MLRLLPFTARKKVKAPTPAFADFLSASCPRVSSPSRDSIFMHVSAEERELVRPVRPGEIAREIEDADAGEGLGLCLFPLGLGHRLHRVELLASLVDLLAARASK